MKLRMMLSAAVIAGLSTFAMADVTGTITYEGKVPARKKINTAAVPYCAQHHPDGMTEETLLVGKDGGLANVVVFIREVPGGEKAKPANENPTIDQVGCRYTPHVLAVMVGQSITYKNSDGTNHNVNIQAQENPRDNFGQANKGDVKKVGPMKAVENFKVKCDVHPWMGAWIAVFDHPHFAVTDAEGKFTIKGVPDGEYEVGLWHEKLGESDGSVTIKDGKGELKATMKPEEAASLPPAPVKTISLTTDSSSTPAACCSAAKPADAAQVAETPASAAAR